MSLFILCIYNYDLFCPHQHALAKNGNEHCNDTSTLKRHLKKDECQIMFGKMSNFKRLRIELCIRLTGQSGDGNVCFDLIKLGWD